MPGRILVIRGGAIGDFILTLPALGLLRDAFPDAHIEILGYRHIVELAVGRHYANASRSIESGPLAGFFNPRSELDSDLCAYFAGFNQIVSYLFDPDDFFGGNLRRAGVRNLLVGQPKLGDHAHAAQQLAAPLEQLALYLEDAAAHIFPNAADRQNAASLLGDLAPVAIHPGSGGPQKNWPLARWLGLADHLLDRGLPLLVIGGESDQPQLAELRARLARRDVRFAEHLPLPALGAVLAGCRMFIGHDSGISHLAAAAGAPCVLLFGPTDPAVWAPANPDVRVIVPSTGRMEDIALDSVRAMVDLLVADA
ncbi:MAG: glycosyltransferase family 9 protein [Terrimicrobiaceae bacterium]|nr:glycosyltransferase family 9 protein [Terrimicrobiaceae bacterium]